MVIKNDSNALPGVEKPNLDFSNEELKILNALTRVNPSSLVSEEVKNVKTYEDWETEFEPLSGEPNLPNVEE